MLSIIGGCKGWMLGALLSAALSSALPLHCAWAEGVPAVQPTEPSARTHFAEQDRDLTHRLAVGLGSVLFIALAGWSAVLLARRYSAVRGLLGRSNGSALKVLAIRRVTARLTVATVQISAERAVVIADNGHAICTLGETPVPQGEGARQ